MTKSKHTQGFWVVVYDDADPCVVQIECDGGGCEGATVVGNDAVPNGILMAAAPELLEAVKAAMRIVDLWLPPAGNHNDEVAVLHKMADQFSSAIAKAEGTTNDQE